MMTTEVDRGPPLCTYESPYSLTAIKRWESTELPVIGCTNNQRHSAIQYNAWFLTVVCNSMFEIKISVNYIVSLDLLLCGQSPYEAALFGNTRDEFKSQKTSAPVQK